MSSLEGFAALIQRYEGSGPALATSSASAEKSRAAPPIPNANTEAVPRINFLIMVIPHLEQVSFPLALLFRTTLPQRAFPVRVCVRSGSSAETKGKRWARAFYQL